MFERVKAFAADAPDNPQQVHWERVRRTPRASDQALTGTTRRWLRELPARRRPMRLCMSHPRVANRLAWCWQDPALSQAALDDLLEDRRGGRRGFAPCIVRELQRLREFNDQQRVDGGDEPLWQRVMRAAVG